MASIISKSQLDSLQIRTLSDMKEEKVIEQEGSYLVLLNLEALEKIEGLVDQNS